MPLYTPLPTPLRSSPTSLMCDEVDQFTILINGYAYMGMACVRRGVRVSLASHPISISAADLDYVSVW